MLMVFSPIIGPFGMRIFSPYIDLKREETHEEKRYVEVAEIYRKMGGGEATFYRWKKKFHGMNVAELRRLRQLEEENRKLKQLVADLPLDKQILQYVVKKVEPHHKRPMVEYL